MSTFWTNGRRWVNPKPKLSFQTSKLAYLEFRDFMFAVYGFIWPQCRRFAIEMWPTSVIDDFSTRTRPARLLPAACGIARRGRAATGGQLHQLATPTLALAHPRPTPVPVYGSSLWSTKGPSNNVRYSSWVGPTRQRLQLCHHDFQLSFCIRFWSPRKLTKKNIYSCWTSHLALKKIGYL